MLHICWSCLLVIIPEAANTNAYGGDTTSLETCADPGQSCDVPGGLTKGVMGSVWPGEPS